MTTHYQGTNEEMRALDLLIKLSRASESVATRINRQLKDSDLTVSQFGVLEALYHRGPMCQSSLAEKILRSTGNLTLVIDHLEQRGLVERRRDTADRRFITVYLTEAGRALIGGLFPQHVDRVVKAVSVLTPDEQVELAMLCRKLGLGQEI